MPGREGGVHVRAPGKLNLFFEVGDLKPDGYHDVASAYQAVSLFEDVWAQDADGFSVSVSGTVELDGVPDDDRNLAVRAARMLAKEVAYPRGVHLEIVKQVPVAGGMGGGSADAAAALVACNALWGAELSAPRLRRLAARLGADVPFAMMGGTAIGTGRGDQLSAALAEGRFDWVIVPAHGELSTPRVYGRLDELRAGQDLDVFPPAHAPAVSTGVLQALRAGDAGMLALHLRNDLQPAALSLHPGLSETLDLGESSGALAGIVSGSGPTIAFLARDAEEALDLQATLATAGRTAWHVHGPVAGTHIL